MRLQVPDSHCNILLSGQCLTKNIEDFVGLSPSSIQ